MKKNENIPIKPRDAASVIIYKKQNNWAIGSDINVINESIKNIGLNSGLSNNIMENCLKDEKLQQQILNERIDAKKNYRIKSTPTIYINKKNMTAITSTNNLRKQ